MLSDNEKRSSIAESLSHAKIGARIQNSLEGIPKETLLSRVEQFVYDKGLVNYLGVFQKGALLAQSPDSFETIEELDEEDRRIIRMEVTNKWSQPRALYMTIFICSLSAAVQGWDQTGANGANLTFPIEFGLINEPGNPNASRNEWLVGLINASPYISACLLGCWLTDPLNNYLGRRGTISICAVFCTLSVIGSACSQTWPQLLVTRLLLGLGMGSKGSTTPMYAAECSPALIRGGLVMSWQLWSTFGALLGFAANLILYQVGDIAWRLQLGSAFLPALPLIFLVFLCPESPRWLMKQNRYHDAFNSFKRLRGSELKAARDLYYAHSQLTEELESMKSSTYFIRFCELFTVPRIRRGTLVSFTATLTQQMCGIIIIYFYSATIFVEAGYSIKAALLASFGFGLINWIFSFPAIWTIDTFGRRNLLLSAFPNMSWSLLAAGFCFYIPSSSPAKVPLIALFVYIFTAIYSPTEGAVPLTYCAEVFPLTHREMGMSWAIAIGLVWSSLLSLTFPRMLSAFGTTGAFGFYAGLNMVSFILVFFLLPETKQRTLEELDYIFGNSLTKHAEYQAKIYLPYWVKRYLLLRKNVELKPLYDFNGSLPTD